MTRRNETDEPDKAMQQQFDFIDTLTASYGFIWRHRRMIALMAFFPLLIKIACLVIVFGLGLEEAYLRQGLLGLPSYFAEGALMAKLVIMAGKHGATINPAPPQNSRPVMAATLYYVLIKLFVAFVGGMGMIFIASQQGENAATSAEGSPAFLLASIFLMAFTIWAARLAWLYIPLAQGYAVENFLHRVRGMKISFIMIGTWLACYIPLGLLLIMTAGLFEGLLNHTPETPSTLYRFIVIIIQSALELTAILASTLAIGFGIHTIMSAPQSKGENA
ncbi:MAG: hypothetical protein LRY36_02625 [Alphaproteobacteria bacterium]|nr:hypothetical protein [Alphaproteobacteria bacterium]